MARLSASWSPNSERQGPSIVNPEQQFVLALLGALTALLVALGGLFVQFRQLKVQMNSRLDELVAINRSAAHAEGKLEGEASPPRLRRVSDQPEEPAF